MIKVVAKGLIKEECVEAFVATAKKLVEASQKEDGNFSYSLNASTANPRVFCFIEMWETKEALIAHSKAPHFLEAMGAMTPMMEEKLNIEMFVEV